MKRTRLPNERPSVTHEFVLGEHTFSITCGFDPESQQFLEVFIHGENVGTTVRGVLDSIAITISYNLQYGVPLSEIIRALVGSRFEPWGRTNNRVIPFASSPVDYIGQWLRLKYTNEVS